MPMAMSVNGGIWLARVRKVRSEKKYSLLRLKKRINNMRTAINPTEFHGRDILNIFITLALLSTLVCHRRSGAVSRIVFEARRQ